MRTRKCCRHLFIAALLGPWLLIGCRRAAYPEARVTTAVGRPAQCSYCSKRIEQVQPEQLVVIGGVQYVVCNDTCAAGVKKRAREMGLD